VQARVSITGDSRVAEAKEILQSPWLVIATGFLFTQESHFLKGEEGYEKPIGGNDGSHICLGSGCDIRAVSSGEGGYGTGSR